MIINRKVRSGLKIIIIDSGICLYWKIKDGLFRVWQ